MKRKNILISTLVAAAATTFSAVPALAAEKTWNTSQSSGEWNMDSNWTNSSKPGDTDTAKFTSDATVTGGGVAGKLNIAAGKKVTFSGETTGGDSSTPVVFEFKDGGSENWGELSVSNGAQVKFSKAGATESLSRWSSDRWDTKKVIIGGASDTASSLVVAGTVRLDASLDLTNYGVFKANELCYATNSKNPISGSGWVIANTIELGNTITELKFENNKLILGTGGIKGGDSGRVFSFGDTTVGATEDWSSSSAIKFDATGDGQKTIFNTGKFDESTKEFSTTEGKTITLSGALTGAGALEKAGEGTLKLTGTTNLSGAISVSGGTLELGGTVTLSSAISNAGTVSLASGVKFELGNLTAGENNVYTLISNQDSGTLTGKAWNSLTKNDFTYQGYALSDRSTIDVSTTSGAVTFNDIRANLTWNGGDSGTWQTSGNSDLWTTSDTGITDTSFHSGDNVTFGASAENKNVSVAAEITAGTVKVSSGDYTFSGGALSGSSLEIASGASLTTNANLNFNGNITISGTLKLSENSSSDIFGGSQGSLAAEIKTGGVLDLNGKQGNTYKIKLSGGMLKNTRAEIGEDKRQISGLELTADSFVVANKKFGLFAQDLGATTINLGTHTLTKQGDEAFFLVNTTVSGTGTIKVEKGTLQLGAGSHDGVTASDATIDIATNASLTIWGRDNVVSTVNKLTGAGTVTIFSGGYDHQRTLIVKGDKQTGTGTIKINSGATFKWDPVKAGSGTDSSGHKSASWNFELANDSKIEYVDANDASKDSYQFEFSGNVKVGTAATDVATISGGWAKEVALLGNLSGAGTLKYSRGASDGVYNSNGRLIIGGSDNSGFTGTVEINAENNCSVGLDLKTSLENGGVNLKGGTTQGAYLRVLGNVSLGKLDGNQYSRIGSGNILAEDSAGDYTLSVGSGTFAGTIQDKGDKRQYGARDKQEVTSGTIALEKIGAGTLTLSGENTFTGGVTVSAGTLVAANASALGAANGAITISGGQLQIGASPSEAVELAADGDDTGTTTVTLNQTAISVVLSDVYKNDGDGKAAITGMGELADNTTITLTDSETASYLATNAPDSSISFKILDSTVTGTNLTVVLAEDLKTHWKLDSFNESTGIATLSMVPEPSAFGLLAGLGALALVASRRRRSRK